MTVWNTSPSGSEADQPSRRILTAGLDLALFRLLS
jgi:hypothetical protein